MKTILLTIIFLITMYSCEEKESRYKTESQDIETARKGITAYTTQDWDSWSDLYADDVKIYDNDWDNPRSREEVLKSHQEMISNLESYKWREEPQFFEEIVDNDGKTWVNYWAVWEGKLKGSNDTIKTPVHLSLNFEDGKVVEQYGFWDGSTIAAEMDRLMNTPVEEKLMQQTRERFVSEFLNNKETAILDEKLADNYVRYMNGEKESEGKQGLIDGMGVYYEGFPDFKLENPTTKVLGNSIFVYWTFTGTNTGEFLGNPPTGKKVSIDGMSEVKFNSEGKVYEEHVFFNQLDMMQQLGYTLAPPSS